MPPKPSLPFFKADPHKWVTDDKASALGLDAFGAWFKIVCHMWLTGEGTGSLEGNVRGLRRLLGAESDKHMMQIIDEMEECGVGCIERDGTMIRFYSPRVKRDWIDAVSRKSKRTEYDIRRRGAEPEPYVPPVTSQRQTAKTSQYEGKDSVEMFTHYTGYNPPIAHAEQIRHRCKNLKMWEATILAWIQEGYKRTNVVSMIEKYESDVAPKATKTIPDKKDSWKISEDRIQARKIKRSCVICGATTPDVGGITGDERCEKISCQASPPKK